MEKAQSSKGNAGAQIATAVDSNTLKDKAENNELDSGTMENTTLRTGDRTGASTFSKVDRLASRTSAVSLTSVSVLDSRVAPFESGAISGDAQTTVLSLGQQVAHSAHNPNAGDGIPAPMIVPMNAGGNTMPGYFGAPRTQPLRPPSKERVSDKNIALGGMVVHDGRNRTQRFCHQCGSEMRVDFKFCIKCGT